jgi:hypothetical protein
MIFPFIYFIVPEIVNLNIIHTAPVKAFSIWLIFMDAISASWGGSESH